MNKIALLDKFAGKKILVVGDVMLDKFIWGNVTRISPEAPVPIVLVKSESYTPGGAANVANNIAELGGIVMIVGVIGNDEAAKILTKELQRRSIVTDNLIVDSSRPTIQKVRVIGHSQQLVRVDYENYDAFGDEILKQLIGIVEGLVRTVDAVVVSDYAKGIANKRVMEVLFALCLKHEKKIIVNPKPKNKHLYKNATVILPNHLEANIMAGIENHNDENLELVGQTLVRDLNSDVIITRGEKGMAIFSKGADLGSYIPTKAKEVYDVTGASDTVAATLALALASGANVDDAAAIANYAAGVVVGKIGTSTVTIGEIRQSIQDE